MPKGGLSATTAVSEDARRKANLRVLQRTDKNIHDIVESANFVGLYEFLQDAQQWDKKQVEGSLFLVKRIHAQERFQLVILNRSSTDNWTLGITPKMQIQNQEPYLILRYRTTEEEEKGNNVIMGIWFHNNQERDTIATLLQKAIQSLATAPMPAPPAPPVADTVAAASALLSPLSLATTTSHDNDDTPTTPSRRTASAPSSANSATTAANHVLDKKSLQLSLLSLLQDDRFLDLIHAQYLKVAHARANRKPGDGGSGGDSLS